MGIVAYFYSLDNFESRSLERLRGTELLLQTTLIGFEFLKFQLFLPNHPDLGAALGIKLK